VPSLALFAGKLNLVAVHANLPKSQSKAAFDIGSRLSNSGNQVNKYERLCLESVSGK
jgi:hypothetical protein